MLSAAGGPEEEIKQSRAFFNRRRPAATGVSSPILQFVFETTRALIPQGTDQQNAIDLGCHWGRYTAVLAETYRQVIGIDFAEEALLSAEPRSNIKYVCIDLNRESERLREFQPVHFFLAIAIFEMVRTPTELLKSMYRSADEGCMALVLIPNRRSINYLSLRLAFWIARHFLGSKRGIYNNKITRQSLTECAKAAGFVIESQGAIVGIPVYLANALPDFIQRFIISTDAFLLNIWGGSYHWVLCKRPRTAMA